MFAGGIPFLWGGVSSSSSEGGGVPSCVTCACVCVSCIVRAGVCAHESAPPSQPRCSGAKPPLSASFPGIELGKDRKAGYFQTHSCRVLGDAHPCHLGVSTHVFPCWGRRLRGNRCASGADSAFCGYFGHWRVIARLRKCGASGLCFRCAMPHSLPGGGWVGRNNQRGVSRKRFRVGPVSFTPRQTCNARSVARHHAHFLCARGLSSVSAEL